NVSAVSGGFVLGAGQTLMGNGTVVGNVTAPGTVSPGASVGALTFANSLTLTGTNVMEIDRAAGTNDLIQCGSTITYGGTLVMSKLTDPLQAGDSYKFFNASSYPGSFSAIVPATPGIGLRWNTSALGTTGTISITAVPRPRITSIAQAGASVGISGTNGQAGSDYWVLTSTDVALPISSWTPLT